MKNFNEFINEGNFGEQDLPNNLVPKFNALKLFIQNVKNELEDKFEKQQDNFGEYVRNVYTVKDENLKNMILQGVKYSKVGGTLIFKVTSYPPLDIEDFIEFFEKMKSILSVKNYMETDPQSGGEVDILIKIPLKWIDDNMLKSYVGIDKFNL